MTAKLFIIGRPGSGKSTAAQYISGIARNRHWNVKRTHIDDYPILQNMTQSQPEKFRLKENGGFDALDLSVLDVALVQVEQKVREIEENKNSFEDHLVTIEFARSDYEQAFQMFNQAFLENSYLLFMHAGIEICLDRIHFRSSSPTCADDHPSFSDEIYKHHFANDNLAYIRSLESEKQSNFKFVKIVENEDSLKDLRPALEGLIDVVLQEEQKGLNRQKIFFGQKVPA